MYLDGLHVYIDMHDILFDIITALNFLRLKIFSTQSQQRVMSVPTLNYALHTYAYFLCEVIGNVKRK